MNKKLTGVVPAAGFANRISPLPCSKEIYPISYGANEETGLKHPKVIAASLFEKFRNAGLQETYMIIRKGKWDIPQYLGTGSAFGLNIAYLVIEPTPGTPHTVDRAYHFVRKSRILFGFPDIQISHGNQFQKLLIRLDNSRADIVLGLFETDKPYKCDMVETDHDGWVKNVTVKPDKSNLTYTWLLAVWDPPFTEFLHGFLSEQQFVTDNKEETELYMGNVIREAIQNDIRVSSVTFPDSTFIDIGTVEDLQKAVRLNLQYEP